MKKNMGKGKSAGIISVGVLNLALGLYQGRTFLLLHTPSYLIFFLALLLAGILILLFNKIGRILTIIIFCAFAVINIKNIAIVLMFDFCISLRMAIALTIFTCVDLGLVFYLTRPKVKEQFKK